MEKLVIIRTLEQLKELQAYLADKDYVAYDTETDGLDKESRIIGFSVSAEVNVGYYVVTAYWDVEKQCLVHLETMEGAKDFLTCLKEKQLVMHNAIFDCFMTENNFQVSLIDSLHTDTMILAHVVNENRSCGLKELAVSIFGEDSKQEQTEMKASVTKNGGVLTREKYELFKADSELIGRYGAKDAILTLNLFFKLIGDLGDQQLVDFFYLDESMPLLKGPTYQLNTTGLRIDSEKLQTLKKTLEAECLEAMNYIQRETAPHVAEKYKGTNKGNTFNVNSNKQLSWLLFFKLENDFHTLTKEGRELCRALDLKVPYNPSARREFVRACTAAKDKVWQREGWNPRTRRVARAKKVTDPWNYIATGKATLSTFASKYKWVEKLLEYKKNDKLLKTYVVGIGEKTKYGIIRPSFLQHGTTSGRYSSRNPNFQNLPRDDKRVKACIVSRPGKVFVGADYSQLEPRVFASFSGDARLLESFKSGDDFYSVIGMEVFDKYDCTPQKDGSPDAFGIKYKKLRDIAKVVALSSTYGTTAYKMAPTIGKSVDEAREVIESYFDKFPSVRKLMLESHKQAMNDGQVKNLFGRPRRIPEAKKIPELFPNQQHEDLDYVWRNLLNLAINHRIQSSGASIMNRAAIACVNRCKELVANNALWKEVKIVLQVHDEIILEGPEALSDEMVSVLRLAMERTVELPGVDLIAEPKIAKNLADLK